MKSKITAATANEKAKTEYTEERAIALFLEMEIWQEHDGYDYRYIRLPERARAHLLKYGSLGREIMLRGELEDEHSMQVNFGYRRAFLAEFWPLGQNNDEDPAGSWELREYRWKSEGGREAARLAIDYSLELAESSYGPIYLDTFFNDAERTLSPADIA